MNIIEVKNNLVKICFEEELTLSGLVQINDIRKSYIAQVLHLESTRVGKFAVAKIIFNYNNGITAYDGTIPSLRSEVKLFESANLLNSLNHENPLILGKLAGQDENIVVDLEMLSENPIILSEKFHTTKTLMGNLALQIQARNKKLVIFDTTGIFNYGKFSLTKDFKLPLNESGINYIYEKEFADATEESKSLIQSIFEELSAYSKTVEFIPFDTFKSVVNSEFMQTKLIQLVIMKNRIKQIKDMNVFAQDKSEFNALRTKLESDNIIIVDISKVKDALKYEAIKYTYSVLEKIGTEFYAFTPVSTESADLTLLEKIRETQNVHTTIICDYDYAYINDLKKNSKNMIMYTPLKQQHDFGGYNIFMQRLAEDEFIAYGKMTKFTPLIGKMVQLNPDDIVIPEEVQEPVEEAVPEEIPPQEIAVPVPPEAPVRPETQEVEDVTAESESEKAVEPVAEEPVPEVEDVQPTVVEEIPTPEVDTIEKPEIDISEMASASAESVQNAQPQAIESVNEIQEALEQVPDVEDEEELSDDDLDMIEELSKPNEEIQAINEEIPQEVQQPQEVVQEIPEQITESVEMVKETVEQVSEPEAAPEVVPEVEEVTEVAQEVVQEPQETPAEEVIKENSVEEEVKEAQAPQQSEPLQTRANSTPSVPEYSAEFPEEDKVNSDPIQQGDRVFHQEFGEGVVEKLINYGDKVLCSINFASVGRRLLNPEISEMKRI